MTSLKNIHRLGLVFLIYGGFLLISYVVTLYFAIWRNEFIPGISGFRRSAEFNSLGFFFSPTILGWLITAFLLLMGGYFIQSYVRQTESKLTKDFVIDSLLTDDEKKVVKMLQEDGVVTQKQVSTKLGYSAVRTHRVLSRLEEKHLISTHPFGMTKKVVLTPP